MRGLGLVTQRVGGRAFDDVHMSERNRIKGTGVNSGMIAGHQWAPELWEAGKSTDRGPQKVDQSLQIVFVIVGMNAGSDSTITTADNNLAFGRQSSKFRRILPR